jgi:LysR family hydrogen peroxide-inducible transcriptional activator
MNLRDLNYVIAVAELRSFVQAAELCCVSQPTLSMQIRKLEDELGVQLFERTNKSVLPTAVGGQIIEAARRIASEVESIREIADAAKDPLAGNLRLGAFPTLSTFLFPALVRLIRQGWPVIALIFPALRVPGHSEPLRPALNWPNGHGVATVDSDMIRRSVESGPDRTHASGAPVR